MSWLYSWLYNMEIESVTLHRKRRPEVFKSPTLRFGNERIVVY